MISEMNPPETYHGEAEFLILGWGSTYGAIRESVDRLRKAKLSVGALHFVDLWPLPADTVIPLIEKCQAFFMVENNSTAQLGQLIRTHTGLVHAGAVLKYDGRPFYPTEIESNIKKYLEKK